MYSTDWLRGRSPLTVEAMGRADCLLITALLNPERLGDWSAADWDLLLRQARQSNLLGRLAVSVADHGGLDQVPGPVQPHLRSALRLAERHARAMHWEVRQIRAALAPAEVPVVLLKGAAYVVAGLPAARGRLFADVDILVPKDALARVEKALFLRGWTTTHLDAYDQRYYRKWMHELPPMQHQRRRTILDVHHNILPETARLHPDPEKLSLSAIPAEPAGSSEIKVLAPPDMVLHAATHLFHEGEFGQGLRDLLDLDALVRDFGRRPDFWPTLVPRARELDLTRPLYYALRYCESLLGTPVPPEVMVDVQAGGPGTLGQAVMDGLFARALMPDHPSCNRRFTGLARWLLYIRAHYLRMPLHLLVPHLLRKATMREAEDRQQ